MKNLVARLKTFLAFIANEFWIISVNCLQFGDTGKGKFIDIFAWLADLIVRCGGGPNAGHTIIFNEEAIALHTVPSGIIHADKINIIGNGVVIDPKTLLDEIKLLQSKGITCSNLKIALNAKVIMPYHLVLDRLGESKAGANKIGTTGRGIGDTYGDHVTRKGLIMNDLLNLSVFMKKLEKGVNHARKILATADPVLVKEIMAHKDLSCGELYQEEGFFNIDAIASKYLLYGEELSSYICDTDTLLQDSVGKKKILLEGAQGYLLSIDHGTYPFVTSSDSSPAGLLKGAGLDAFPVDVAFGIIKGFYMTRVGAGPFPTEMGGKESDVWCNGGVANRKLELEKYPNADINDEDPMIQGVALRREADEYGATTQRPRRVGWLDLPLLRYALKSGVKHIIMTKLDVLTGIKVIKVCYAYEYCGPDFRYGDRTFTNGMILHEAVPISEVLEYCKPMYHEFNGWTENIKGIENETELPVSLQKITRYISSGLENKAQIVIVSDGPKPEQTIFINPKN